MKIFIISPRFPFAQGKADSMTVFHLIKYLYEQNHQVILTTFENQEKFPQEERQLLYDMCEDVCVVDIKKWKVGSRILMNIFSRDPFQVAYYRDKWMSKCVKKMIEKHQPDILYAHLIRAAHYIKDYVKYPRILAMQIAQTLNYKRLIKHERNTLRRFFYTQEYHRVFKMEPAIIEQFDRVLLISPHDTNAIAHNGQAGKIFYSPHGIDVAYFSEDQKVEKEQNTIIMNGDFGVPTNIDATLSFYQQIYPLVRAKVPDAKLWLVGRNPAAEILDLKKDPSVMVTGKVPDIRPYLQKANVGIAPLRVGAGLQNKVLVSLASQLPVVVTEIANEGIAAPANEVLLVAKDEDDFADKIIDLLNNEKERRRLGENALAYMQKYWTWEFHFEKLENMMSNLIENRQAHTVNYYPFKNV